MTRYVIEYVCPVDGIDYDVEEDEVTHGTAFDCPGCGGQHRAGVDVSANVLDLEGRPMFSYEAEE